MSGAQRLRDAASKLREMAEAATGGSWGVVGTQGLAISPSRLSSAVIASATAKDDAAFIALMAPPVALALADWLDAEAHHHDRFEQAMAEVSEPVMLFDGSTLAEAVAVADAILGTNS
jgi:hypothetical protein